MSKPRYVRIVSLWIRPGQELAFEAFEQKAARIMARHGGHIDRAIRTHGSTPDAPFEVHVVSFPNRAAADSCANDPETMTLRSARADIIARTEVLDGVDTGPY